ncbi:MAG: YgiT-type zinc finger protein [Magnetococcus sp. YQC-3]
MRCHVCGSELLDTITTLPFKVGESAVVVLKDLPVTQCSNCQEFVIHDVVMARVEAILDQARLGAELEVVRYAA